MIAISIVKTSTMKTIGSFISSFIRYLWKLSSLSLKRNDIMSDILSTIWLLLSVVILGSFSGSLYGRLMIRRPPETLDSMEMLLQENNSWSKSKLLIVLGVGEFDVMLMDIIENRSSVARSLFERFELVDPFDILYTPNVAKESFEGIMKGNDVMSLNQMHAYYVINMIASNDINFMSNFEEGIDYHISDTDTIEPYFLLTYKNQFNGKYLKALNSM